MLPVGWKHLIENFFQLVLKNEKSIKLKYSSLLFLTYEKL